MHMNSSTTREKRKWEICLKYIVTLNDSHLLNASVPYESMHFGQNYHHCDVKLLLRQQPYGVVPIVG